MEVGIHKKPAVKKRMRPNRSVPIFPFILGWDFTKKTFVRIDLSLMISQWFNRNRKHVKFLL